MSGDVTIHLREQDATQIALLLSASCGELPEEMRTAISELLWAIPGEIRDAQFKLWEERGRPSFIVGVVK